jgi:hypothetical protein
VDGRPLPGDRPGNTRSLLASLDRFHSGGWHYQGAMTPDLVHPLPETPSAPADIPYELVVHAAGPAVPIGVDSDRESAITAVAVPRRIEEPVRR